MKQYELFDKWLIIFSHEVKVCLVLKCNFFVICINGDDIAMPCHAYPTARLGPSFLGDLDWPYFFAWLDALGSQHRAFLTPGPGHLGFPSAWLTSSLTWWSSHRRCRMHCWVLHTPVCQCPKALRQHYCMGKDKRKTKIKTLWKSFDMPAKKNKLTMCT